jgi:hypothetical protein
MGGMADVPGLRDEMRVRLTGRTNRENMAVSYLVDFGSLAFKRLFAPQAGAHG